MRYSRVLVAALTALAIASCEGVDCPLANVVALRVGFYRSGTDSTLTLADTLTVTAVGTDSVVVNRLTGASSLELPLSYFREADTLCLNHYGEDYETDDYLIVAKTNDTHFENPDCPTVKFHTLTSVAFESPYGTIDSVRLVNPSVNYGLQENIQIFFHAPAPAHAE